MTFAELAALRDTELERHLLAGQAPDLALLEDTEWRGWNVSPLTEVPRIRKFIKGFFGTSLEGYNKPARQNGWDGEWEAVGERFGFYTVTKVDPDARDNFYPNAVLLDYGASRRNASYRVEKVLRDYLVQPDPKNPALLLGKAYAAVGPLRIPVGFFLLSR